MGVESRYTGVNFNNLRKALYLLYFGIGEVKDSKGNVIKALSQDFDSPKYKYIIPMQGDFENPSGLKENDTYILFWIEKDTALTQDDYVQYGEDAYNRQKCVASVLLRFVGAQAETWAKAMRHLAKRSGVTQIWSGVCNAEKLEYTSPIIPRRVHYSGRNSEVAFDLRFKLYYDECIPTGWKPLTGVDFNIEGNIHVEDNSNMEEDYES